MVGVTDEHGKYYDLQFVNENFKLLKSHQLDLVTARDANEENMSFGTYVITQHQIMQTTFPTKNKISQIKLIYFKNLRMDS